MHRLRSLVVLGCGTLAAAFAQSDEWLTYLKNGEVMHSQRRYAGAQKSYQEARRVATTGTLQEAVVLQHEGQLEQDLGNLGAAQERYERALAIESHVLGPNDPALARVLNDLSSVHFSNLQLTRSEQYLLRSRALVGRGSSGLGDWIRATENLAALRLVQRRFGEAESLAREAIAARVKAGPELEAGGASAWNTLALVYGRAGNLASAHEAAEKASGIARQTAEAEPAHAVELIILGSIEYDAARYGEADRAFREARRLPATPGLPLQQRKWLLATHARTLRALHKSGEAKEAEREARALAGELGNARFTVEWADLPTRR